MNRRRYDTLIEAAATGSVIAVANLLVALILFITDPVVLVIHTASNFLFIESAVMFIVGGCLMAREPLADDTDVAGSGRTGAHDITFRKMANLGRKTLLTALFVFLFGALFALAL